MGKSLDRSKKCIENKLFNQEDILLAMNLRIERLVLTFQPALRQPTWTLGINKSTSSVSIVPCIHCQKCYCGVRKSIKTNAVLEKDKQYHDI